MIGAFFTWLIAFFAIVATAATLHTNGIVIETAGDAALALKPLAGKYASQLFSFGLLGASLLAAFILPLSTAYAICEAFGFEHGVDHEYKDAPVFFGLYTALIVIGALLVLWPGLSLFQVMLASQVVNGVLLPPILIFMVLIASNRHIMGSHANSGLYNVITWIFTIVLIILTLMLLAWTLLPEQMARLLAYLGW